MNVPHKPKRKSTNVLLDADMVGEAKELGLSVSRACETGLAAALKTERERRWLEENREAIAASNAWVARNGLPLAKFRQY